MSLDRRAEHRPSDQIGRTFFDALHTNPVTASKLLTIAYDKPPILAQYHEILRARYGNSETSYEQAQPWIHDLLARYSPQSVPDTVVSLGSGGGFELLYLRRKFPRSDLVAIENDEDLATIESLIACVGLTEARLLLRDMADITADHLAPGRQLGNKIFTICRHPGPLGHDVDFELKRKWLDSLAKWTISAVYSGGSMLITTFDQNEMAPIEFVMLALGLPIKRSVFTGGHKAIDYKREAIEFFNQRSRLYKAPYLDWLDRALAQFNQQDARMDSQVMVISK